jgi:hypothetical protein
VPEPGLDTVLRHSRDVLHRDLEGEAVLVDLRSGTYLGLDGVATFIWHQIGKELPLRTVLEEVLANYDVDYETARRDLLRLAGELLELRLVDIAEPTGGGGPPPVR